MAGVSAAVAYHGAAAAGGQAAGAGELASAELPAVVGGAERDGLATAAAGCHAASGGGLAAAKPAAGAGGAGRDGLAAAAASGMAASGDVHTLVEGLVGAGAPPPPVIAPGAWLPEGTFGHSKGEWTEIRSEKEHISYDMTCQRMCEWTGPRFLSETGN